MTRQEKIDTIKDTLGLTDGQLKAMLAADELPGEQDKKIKSSVQRRWQGSQSTGRFE